MCELVLQGYWDADRRISRAPSVRCKYWKDRQTEDSMRRQYTLKWSINTWRQSFSTVFAITRDRPSSLPWARRIQITSIYIRFQIQINNLILPRLGLPCCLFPSGFVAEIWWCFFPISYVLQIQPIPFPSSDLLFHTSLKTKLRNPLLTITPPPSLSLSLSLTSLSYACYSLRAAEVLTTVLVIYTEYRNITFSTPFWGFAPTDRYSDSLHGAIRSLQFKDKTVFYARPRSFCLSSHTAVLFRHTIYYLIPHKICRRRFILKLSIPCIFV